MKIRQSIFLLAALALIALLTACSSSSKTTTTPPVISVSLSPAPPASLATSAQTPITAVTNDTAGVGWTVSCGSAGACGSFNPTSTLTGAATTYTAPAAVPTGNTVTVTATSKTDPTKFAQATITITSAAVITVTLSPTPPTTLSTTAQTPVTAVTNDTAGVNWSVTCGSAGACGSFNPTSTLTGVATTYTAPAIIPIGNTVTVTATSVTDTTKSASAVINITGPPLADGNYVFSVSGRDAISGGAPYSVAGAFTIAGGVITGGEQDFGDAGTIVSDLINSTGNNISATSDGNLQIVLNICNGTDCTTTDTSVGVNGVETFNGTLYCNCTALITEFDSSATAGGVLDLQTNPSAPSGGYAFALGGIDSGASTVVIGGILNIDSPGGISGAGSVFDINDAGLAAPLQAQTFDASTVSALDSFGRVTITLNPSVASGIAQIVLVGYVADSKHIRLVETSDNFGGTTGGTALGQGPNTGLITTIAGNSYVVGVSGQETAGGVLQAAGLLTANSDGTLSGTVNYNDLTGVGTQVPISITGGAYTIDPTGTGYVTMTGVTDGTANFNLQLYLTGDGHALAATMDTNDALVGLGFGQVGVGNFTAGSFSGKYAMGVGGVDSVSENEFDAAGPITADGVSAFSGTADLNQLFGATSPDLTVSGTFTADPSGIFTGTMTGVDVTTNTNTDNFVYYLIDNQRVISIEVDPNQLTLGYFQLEQ